MGLRWRLRVVYTWASPLLRPFWAENFEVPSKIGQKFPFLGKMGSKYKFLFSRPPKGTSLRETTSFDVLIVKIGTGVLAVRCRKNPKKTSRVTSCEFSHIWGTQEYSDRYEILHMGMGPRRNHPCKFWWRSVQGFWEERGSNFPLFHWLTLSPLKHSGTTMPECDAVACRCLLRIQSRVKSQLQ